MFHEPTPDGNETSMLGGAGSGTPSPAEPTIFRSEALQRYIEEQERTVLPRLVSPKVFVYLWVLAGLLMASGLLVAFWPILRQFMEGVS